jgi:hypothetical protein
MRRVILTIGCLVLFFSFTPVKAEIIQIGLTGLVDSVNDPYNLLENGVHQNDSITGFYIYDSETPDSTPELTWNGLYEHTAVPYGMSLTIGEITFQTDTTDVDFVVWIENDFDGTIKDRYRITSYNNLPLNGLCIDRLSWFLDDYSGDAISTKELPNTPPDLSAWQSNTLIITGPSGSETFEIIGHVTDVWLIPEPATLFLFGLGGLLLRKRK